MGNCINYSLGSVCSFYAKITNKVKSVWVGEEAKSRDQFYPAIYDEETGNYNHLI